MAIEPLTLRGVHVELVPLAVEHAGDLAAAAADRSTYDFTEVPDGAEAMSSYIDQAAGATGRRARRCRSPSAGSSTAALVGCTRFMELRWWRGRAEPDEVEVGGTWLAADAQRTPINTEAKLLLLTHAFEVWQVWRVALCTDARNERSRRAIERIGARHEGVLRNHRPSAVTGEAGRPRDSALFAVTDSEWPDVRRRLLGMLGARLSAAVRLVAYGAARWTSSWCAPTRGGQLHARRHGRHGARVRAGRPRGDHARSLRARVRPGDERRRAGRRTTATSRCSIR